MRRQANARKETKLFRDYARQSFEDTLTLYLHGTCCDIDVETGPRQMPSRYLRKRLELLYSLYPPPEGYAVFPEQLKKRLPPGQPLLMAQRRHGLDAGGLARRNKDREDRRQTENDRYTPEGDGVGGPHAIQHPGHQP